MQEAEWNLIEGTVEAVIYQNRENGYTVLRLDAGEGKGLTVVGCMPGVAPGERISKKELSYFEKIGYNRQEVSVVREN